MLMVANVTQLMISSKWTGQTVQIVSFISHMLITCATNSEDELIEVDLAFCIDISVGILCGCTDVVIN